MRIGVVSDTHNNFIYDEINDRWLMYVRPRAFAGNDLKHVGRRRVAVKESPDLVKWTHEQTVLVPEENDPDYFYAMTVFRRGDLFFGQLQMYETVFHPLSQICSLLRKIKIVGPQPFYKFIFHIWWVKTY